MRIKRLLAVISVMAVALPRAVAAQAVCPTEGNATRAKVVRLLTSQSRAELRQQYGLTNVDPAHLVLLTDAVNGAACQQLRDIVKPGQSGRYPQVFSYYYADGFYFVAFAWVVPAGQVWTAYAPVMVFRSDFTYVDAFAM